jgi:CRISPR type III-associated protein (TIGR04423 family)
MIINEHLTSIPNSNENPFIIEGNLFDKNHQFSYYIKYVDGEYLVFRYEMDKTEDLFTLENYIPNKLPGVDKICFRQYWKSGPDDFCEGMEVLKPFTSVFVGFKYKEK